MRLLPIVWGQEPTDDDWRRLASARVQIGHDEPIGPARAVQGSPDPILCIGRRPDWITRYVYVDSTSSPNLADALGECLAGEGFHIEAETELLSSWFGVPVTQIAEERSVQFV